MAESKNNIVTHGLSGKIGDLLVFSQRNGKTIVSKVPVRTAESTDAQLQVREKFQKAVFYAKGALADADTKALYKADAKNGKTAYNVAIADFFDAPDIRSVDFSNYTGQPGSTIHIEVLDDFKVGHVSIKIANSDGAIVEQGKAAAAPDGLNWIYTATQINESLTGDKITVYAGDLAANLSVKENILN